ncbi:MAG: hypothetical protein ACYTBX_11660 [Planctomycetota bacterium]|jgi:hypothetical protein
MNDPECTILDHMDNIVVPGLVFKNPTNEYWALICLRDGMNFLYRQAKCCDDAIKSRVNPKDNIKYMGIGNLPEFQGIPKSLLTCSFHWYSISACQYVRTIGTIAYQNDNTRPKPLEYTQRVIPDILAFRDKVGAHFAWTTKHKQDNDAERIMSILPQLTFNDNSFHVGSISLSLKKDDKISKSETVKAWSICKVHEKLQERYWPNKEKKEIS